MWPNSQLQNIVDLFAPFPCLNFPNPMLQIFALSRPETKPPEAEEEQALDLSLKSPKCDMTESSQSSIPSCSDSSSVHRFLPFGLEPDLSCPICKKLFRFEKNLLRHLQKTHAAGSEESILKCKLCPYTTRHYSNMYVHIRTHTGDKPYSCSGCGASFTQGSSLKLHIRSRHDENMALFSLSRKPGKSNLSKLWTRVVRMDSSISLPVAQSSLYLLPSRLMPGQFPYLQNLSTASESPTHAEGAVNPVCNGFSVEALTSPPSLQTHSFPQLGSSG